MKQRVTSTLALSLFMMVSVMGLPAAASGSTPSGEDQLQGSARFGRNGWVYVRLAGPPARGRSSPAG